MVNPGNYTITYDSTAAVLNLNTWYNSGTPTGNVSASKIILSANLDWDIKWQIVCNSKQQLVFDGQGKTITLVKNSGGAGTSPSNFRGLISAYSGDDYNNTRADNATWYGIHVKNLIIDSVTNSIGLEFHNVNNTSAIYNGCGYLFGTKHGQPWGWGNNGRNQSAATTTTSTHNMFICEKVEVKAYFSSNQTIVDWCMWRTGYHGGNNSQRYPQESGAFAGFITGRIKFINCMSNGRFHGYGAHGRIEYEKCFVTSNSILSVYNLNRQSYDAKQKYIFKNCVSYKLFDDFYDTITHADILANGGKILDIIDCKVEGSNYWTSFSASNANISNSTTSYAYLTGSTPKTVNTSENSNILTILGNEYEIKNNVIQLGFEPSILSITHDCDMLKGSIQRIHFTTLRSNNVKLELVNGSNSLTIASSVTSSTGFFDWTIPTDLSMNPSTPITGNCFIKVTDTTTSVSTLTSSIPITIYKALGGSDTYTTIGSPITFSTTSRASYTGYVSSDTLCNGKNIYMYYDKTTYLKGRLGESGAEFNINTTVVLANSDNVKSYNVIALKQGGFFTMWNNNGPIRGRWFNDDGTAVGNDFLIISTTNSNSMPYGYKRQSIDATHDGGFIMTYYVHGGEHYAKFVKYNKNETTADIAPTRINTTTQSEYRPTCCVLKNGNYLLSARYQYSIYNSKTKAFISQEKDFDMVNVIYESSDGQNIKTLENGNILFVSRSDTSQGHADDFEVYFTILKQATDSSQTLTNVKQSTRVNTASANTRDWFIGTTVINGGFIVSWYNQIDTKPYYRVYDIDGNSLSSDTQIGSTTNIFGRFNRYSGYNGYVLTYNDTANTTYYALPYTFVNVFTNTTISESSVLQGVNNTLTFTIASARQIASGETVTIKGLTGSQTADNASLTVSGTNASLFGSSGNWNQSTGTLVLTLGSNMTESTDYTFTISLQNKATSQTAVTPTVEITGTNAISATSMGSGVLSSITTPTFLKYDVHESTIVQGQTNKIRVNVRPQVALTAGQEIRITGLTGTTTVDNSTMGITGAGASLFTGNQGVWTQTTGTFILVVASGKIVPSTRDTEIIFEVVNPGSSNGTGSTVDVSGTGLAPVTSLHSLLSAQTAAAGVQSKYFMWFNYGGIISGPYGEEYSPKGTEGPVVGTDFGKNYARASNYYVPSAHGMRGTSWEEIYNGGAGTAAWPNTFDNMVVGEEKYSQFNMQNLDTLGCLSGYGGDVAKQGMFNSWTSRRIRSNDVNSNFNARRGIRLNNDDAARNEDKIFPYGVEYGVTGAVSGSNDTGPLSSSSEFSKEYYIENDRRYQSHTATALDATTPHTLKYITDSLLGESYSGTTLTSKNESVRFKFTFDRHPPSWDTAAVCPVGGCPTPSEQADAAAVNTSVKTAITSAAVAAAPVSNDGKLDVNNQGVKDAIAAMKAELSAASVNNTSSSRRKKRGATLNLLFSQNLKIKQIKMKKTDLSLPATFIKADVVVIKAGETIDVSAFDSSEGGTSGFYSILDDGQVITLTIANKTLSITRTDDGGVENYYLTNTEGATITDVTSAGSFNPITNPTGSLKDGDRFTVESNRILFIGSVGDGGSALAANESNITVGAKTGGGTAYFYNSLERPTIVFISGTTYLINHPVDNPFRFSELPDGTHGGTNEYVIGVTRPSNTSVSFTVSSTTPSTLYYYSSANAGMGGVADIQYAASGADPYVHPIRGLTYKFPNKEAHYRLYENDDVFINGSVKLADKEKMDSIQKYFKHSELNKIVTDGYFYSGYFIAVGKYKFVIDMKSFKFLTTKNSHEFFKFKITKENVKGTWEKGDALVLNVSWKHEIHGKMSLDIVKYENPQIDSMIRLLKYPCIENTVGALIRNYRPKLMEVPKLNSMVGGKIARKLKKTNKKYTKKDFMLKNEVWVMGGKKYNCNQIKNYNTKI
jgi:hypothetical protein